MENKEIKKALRLRNSAFANAPVNGNEFEDFKKALRVFFKDINEDESEENQKNDLKDFLRDSLYKDYYINTHGRKDLVIHNNKTEKDPISVIFENKKIGSPDMFTPEKPNVKSLQQLIFYYLRQRIDGENNSIKHLIITDAYRWCIFDENIFENIFFTLKFTETYKAHKNDAKSTDKFYKTVEPLIEKHSGELKFTFFDLRDYEKQLTMNTEDGDKQLIPLFKLLSPTHLLKLPYANDANQLDKGFYNELLHIIGLEEVGDKSNKKTIDRKAEDKRDKESLIENTLSNLEDCDLLQIPQLSKFGSNAETQRFNIALELCITWVNRILFLKLLEAQLVKYHTIRASDYLFLNAEKVNDFGELNKLFFKVLAEPNTSRSEDIQKKYGLVPYLNSSLFELTELEQKTIRISNLDNNLTLKIYNSTVLKIDGDKKRTVPLKTLHYFFEFLNAYNFASEGHTEIQKDEKKLINAAVLGLIFEKINGYKDGSFFTPAFITMYMCRQTIRRAVVQKFNEANNWDVKEFDELHDKIEHTESDARKRANDIINSLKICDPAVGSGHFLVSALNEIITIKSELKVLSFKNNGDRIKGYLMTVENDELKIIDEESGDIFSYVVEESGKAKKEKQDLQETLFHEKQTIIENCLFGVDINPNSVKICRLRLWIELLKNAYYSSENVLETLPNIDINIKEGNSLISQFALNDKLNTNTTTSKQLLKEYKEAVKNYFKSKDKNEKQKIFTHLKEIKEKFSSGIGAENTLYKDLFKKKREFNEKYNSHQMFEISLTKEQKKDKKNCEDEIENLEKKVEEKKPSLIYRNSMEWRFEFPEVLNENGEYIGFDVVIGNPPYGVTIKNEYRVNLIRQIGKVPDFEIYYYFIELSLNLLRISGKQSFIIPNSILFNVFANKYRKNLLKKWKIDVLLDCTNFSIFDGATVRNVLTFFSKQPADNNYFKFFKTNSAKNFSELVTLNIQELSIEALLKSNQNWGLVFRLDTNILELCERIILNSKKLIDFFPKISQGLIAYDKYQGQDEFTIKNRIFHSFVALDETYKKWLHGEDVTPFSIKWNEKEFIQYSSNIANPREPIYFIGRRLLIREITNPKIFVGFTDEEFYNDPSIIIILENQTGDIKLEILIGILNSKLLTFLHFNNSPKATKGSFPKILVEDIKNFPIPKISLPNQQPIITLVEQILAIKKENPMENTLALEAQIDALVYKLYDLTEAEIAIVEGGVK